MAWSSSTRAARLPPDWKRIVKRILRRDPLCICRGEAEGCDLHPGRPCGAASTEVDHLRRGDDHDDSNLGGKCSRCHRKKTLLEALAARKRAPRTREPEPHPGRIRH